MARWHGEHTMDRTFTAVHLCQEPGAIWEISSGRAHWRKGNWSITSITNHFLTRATANRTHPGCHCAVYRCVRTLWLPCNCPLQRRTSVVQPHFLGTQLMFPYCLPLAFSLTLIVPLLRYCLLYSSYYHHDLISLYSISNPFGFMDGDIVWYVESMKAKRWILGMHWASELHMQ